MSNYRNNQKHSFHLVDPSPWPLFTGITALMLTIGMVKYMHGYSSSTFVFISLILLVILMFIWWRDVIREATFEGQHTTSVQNGLRMGMILFIVSEIMFFFAFFWAFFHSSFNPSPAIGGVWPPAYLVVLDPWKVPLLNTAILLLSGVEITLAHNGLISGSYNKTFDHLVNTIGLAIIFTLLQYWEYQTAPFTISDGIYGSCFYMATGFHGFHVIIGTCFLIVTLVRLHLSQFTIEHHFGFEAAAWYWHFVDVVWLFLFITMYWWGS